MPQKKLHTKSFFIPRHWTTQAQNFQVEKNFPARKFDAEIKNSQGEILFQMKSVLAPQSWSSLAVDIASSRYLRRGKEKSIYQLVHRVASALALSAVRQGYLRESHKGIFLSELKFILLSQRASFNSPVWFNVGLFDQYQLSSYSHHWIYSSKMKKAIPVEDAYRYPQCSACFIQNVEDKLEDIFQLAQNEARLFKYGSGSGTNFSKLRSKYEDLETGGKSSGLISFLDVLDKGAGAVKSGGTTRRAAKMVIVDVDHPEIIDFIRWKSQEEAKAKILIQGGYSSDFEGPAYKTVSGQNANNSVRLSDDFMKAVISDRLWPLKFRNGKVYKKIPAREIFEELSKAAWDCADPGVQFQTQIQSWNTCSAEAEIRASNPCSEFMFLDNTACNLSSLNLLKFLDNQNQFDLEGFLHTAKVMFISQEILIDYSSYPTAEIAENSHNYRPLGLGFAGLGAFLMRQGIPYDSELARDWAFYLTSLLQGQAYLTSAEMAQNFGPFPAYKKNKNSMQKVLLKHFSFLKKKLKEQNPDLSILQIRAEQIWLRLLDLGIKYGYRNSQATAIAPTGTIGLVMDCDTTGIEPEFSLIKHKKLVGGGLVEIVSQSVEPALHSLGYSIQQIAQISEYLLSHKTIVGAPELLSRDYKVFECAHGDLSLSAEGHLKMMAAVQPMVSGAISKTVNLSRDASVEDVKQIFFKAWRLGLKSISVYRDGSKGTQPLTAAKSNVKNEAKSDTNGEPNGEPKSRAASFKKTGEKSFPAGFSTMKCPECGAQTELRSGCYRCPACGFTAGCG